MVTMFSFGQQKYHFLFRKRAKFVKSGHFWFEFQMAESRNGDIRQTKSHLLVRQRRKRN